jgi:hypothetical protein
MLITPKVLASLLQLHGPGATIQSDHEGIAALLNDLRADKSEQATEVYFRKAGPRGCSYSAGAGAFRRGGFVRGY